MGHRPTGFSNHHDENWPSQAFKLHGVLEEVTQFSIKSNSTFQTKIKVLTVFEIGTSNTMN